MAEVEGNQLDEEKTYQLLKDAMDAGKNEVDLEAAGCYLEPAVRTSDENLQKQYETLKKYENMTITYLIGDQKEVLDSLTIRKWMNVADDGSVTFNWNMAADWAGPAGGQIRHHRHPAEIYHISWGDADGRGSHLWMENRRRA